MEFLVLDYLGLVKYLEPNMWGKISVSVEFVLGQTATSLHDLWHTSFGPAARYLSSDLQLLRFFLSRSVLFSLTV